LIDANEKLTAAATDTGLTSTQAIADLCRAWRHTDPDRALMAASMAAETPRMTLTATALSDAAELLRTRRRRHEADRVAQQAAARWAALGAYADADACTTRTRAGRPIERRPKFGVPALTPTERRIVGLVAEGLPNSTIAATVGISRRTVESHVSAAYRKLEVTSRVALTRVALTHHIADANPAG
jgi:DNA-binding NarL/FixJ family response regulator